uniref:Photosystem I assembly protein Ycf37 n=1 Tax=Dipterocladia arabiensis TaxID=2007176 RepID=A0A1Z1M036_9FLOR|nr:hypothetical protein [Dipterocladia arabiensis]ARW59288.1 hypothetical protein [Dipterocladia arabiensis]
MNTNLLLFYVYLIIIVCFLLFLSYLISLELINLLYYIIFKYNKFNINEINENIYLFFVSLYTKRKQWFLCISMLEFLYLKKISSLPILNNNLAYCYKNLSYSAIAEFYYLKGLSYSPFNIMILKNLFQFYTESKNYDKAKKINERIISLNNS